MVNLSPENLGSLETPCIVIDVALAERNIRRMQKIADSCGCKLRPHIKTHKMPFFARKQVEAGADGITCAKITEAEIMAQGGIDDIFVAYPIVGDFRIRRAIVLQKQIRRLILAVDSLAGAQALNSAAEEAGVVFEVRLEVDTGAKRTGVLNRDAVDLAVAVSRMTCLNLTGIYTFKGLIYEGNPTTDNHAAGVEEGRLMSSLADRIRAAGVTLREISGGSTPTGAEVAKTGDVTEIRPGTYIFNDYMQVKEHAAERSEIAVRIYATVVSVPGENYAVVDGGTKTFPTDVPLHEAPYFYPGYAVVEERDDLQLLRMNEEHGIISGTTGTTGLKIGEKIALIPLHVCTAINMQNSVYLLEDGKLTKCPVAARGMLV